jgi:hypothetical protein
MATAAGGNPPPNIYRTEYYGVPVYVKLELETTKLENVCSSETKVSPSLIANLNSKDKTSR